MRKILLTLPALLLASCGVLGGPPAPNPGPAPLPDPVPPVTTPDPGPQPQPQPTAPFIPAAGAAVGTGDGTKLGTVYVSPNAQEVDFMTLLNEVRTKGTVNGVDVRAGTCLAGVEPGTLKPLTYNGVMAYASRKHSTYLGTWGFEGHNELNTAHPNFYGASYADRVTRAYQELADGAFPNAGGEMVAYGSGNSNLFAAQTVTGFVHSLPHCQILAQNNIASIGVGYIPATYENATPTKPIVYRNNWTVTFGR
ncbi:CAP domain-containing protein [Deinococcus radiophilus]|uniref:CAP domain-containing protein n=1 Tax=Deinococcus radiophilus TaxID=32062 RepID=A0A431VLD8_9DEIO|nr:CAP domain-containing protein [Deinococcus radiophilus]RTR23128.1 CAP domain-containing protein [Deinococcus radiophilus]